MCLELEYDISYFYILHQRSHPFNIADQFWPVAAFGWKVSWIINFEMLELELKLWT